MAAALPMPDPAPVISATLSWRSMTVSPVHLCTTGGHPSGFLAMLGSILASISFSSMFGSPPSQPSMWISDAIALSHVDTFNRTAGRTYSHDVSSNIQAVCACAVLPVVILGPERRLQV
jgi:hypothetical protein